MTSATEMTMRSKSSSSNSGGMSIEVAPLASRLLGRIDSMIWKLAVQTKKISNKNTTSIIGVIDTVRSRLRWEEWAIRIVFA